MPRGVPNKPNLYHNVTRNNVFTEKGRVGPGQTVELTASQAKVYGDALKKLPGGDE